MWGGVHQSSLWVQATLQVGFCPHRCPLSLSPLPFSFLSFFFAFNFAIKIYFPAQISPLPPCSNSLLALHSLPDAPHLEHVLSCGFPLPFCGLVHLV